MNSIEALHSISRWEHSGGSGQGVTSHPSSSSQDEGDSAEASCRIPESQRAVGQVDLVSMSPDETDGQRQVDLVSMSPEETDRQTGGPVLDEL